MKLYIAAVLLTTLILVCIIPVTSQEDLPESGTLPDSPFYPVKIFVEKVRVWITFDSEARAKIRLQHLDIRLAEMNEMIKRNKTEYVGGILRDFETEQNYFEADSNRTRALGRNITALAEYVSNVTYKHILILEKVLAKVPEQARPAIEHAINVSIRGHEQAVESILERINKTTEEVRKVNCTVDADCRHLFCPQVLGSDTPVCEEEKCKCGGRWQIINKTEWRERFREELTSEIQEIQERIREFAIQSRKEKCEESGGTWISEKRCKPLPKGEYCVFYEACECPNGYGLFCNRCVKMPEFGTSAKTQEECEAGGGTWRKVKCRIIEKCVDGGICSCDLDYYWSKENKCEKFPIQYLCESTCGLFKDDKCSCPEGRIWDDNVGCRFKTEEEVKCLKPEDCEGLPAPECVGYWTCVDNKCKFECGTSPTITETTIPRLCPAVCIPLWEIKNNQCVFNDCGSGCGADNIKSFDTEEACKAKLGQTIRRK